jgi:hypothetical protein
MVALDTFTVNTYLQKTFPFFSLCYILLITEKKYGGNIMLEPEKKKKEDSVAYQNFRAVLDQMTKKDKIFAILQIILSTIIIIVAILGLNHIGNTYVNNMIDMGLLVALLIISAIRIFKRRKVYATLYIIIAAFVVYIMVAPLFR